MQIVLKPKSHPGMEDLEITQSPFAIGRLEEPFVSADSEDSSRLSRRHARIFEEMGEVFVADLDSLNGTTVNGTRVKQQAIKLEHGDELGFAGFTFMVELPQAENLDATMVFQAPQISLTLTPTANDERLDLIVVTRFPFLISKVHGVFAGYQETLADKLASLSRRHALVFHRDDKLYVEDLGSTNGTFVDGHRLSEKAVELTPNATISFGDELFSYRIGIDSGEQTTTEVSAAATLDETASLAPREPTSSGLSNTVFVSSADSFLDMYLQDNEASSNEPPAATGGDDQAADSAAGSGSGKRPGAIRRAAVFISRLKGGDKPSGEPYGSKYLLAGGMLVLLVALLLFLLYTQNSGQQSLKSLIADNRLDQAIALADQQLAEDPDNEDIRRLATEALIKSLVPRWIAAIDAGAYADASALLAERPTGGRTGYGEQHLQILGLSGEVAALLQPRAERPSLRLSVLDEATPVKALLDRWNADSTRNSRILSDILQLVPSFRERYELIYSQMRQLQEVNAVDLRAISSLKKEIDEHLNGGDSAGIGGLILRFQSEHPTVAGVDSLQADLKTYQRFELALREQDLETLADPELAAAFSSASFAQGYTARIAPKLPPEALLGSFQQAMASWSEGEGQAAVAMLEPLQSDAQWGPAVTARLDRYQDILASLEALNSNQSAEQRRSQVLVLYAKLDPQRDRHYRQLIAAEVEASQGETESSAKRQLAEAMQHWSDYLDQDGIGGLLRLEDRVSEKFSSQAKRLTLAATAARQAAEGYRMIGQEMSLHDRKLLRDINAENKRQRQWISELKNVLRQDVIEAKLKLLEVDSGKENPQ